MEKYYVAPSYQSATIVKVNEETHKALIEEKCPRCSGLGFIVSRVENGQYIPIPVDGGICYQCNGEKIVSKWVKAYTEKEYEKYVASQKRAKERKVEAAEARRVQALAQSEENRKSRLVEWGYDPENPLIWLVGGGNTYEIKDWLKEQGCKFCKELGWYSCKPLDVPVGYGMVSVKFEDVYEWFPMTKRFELKENAKECADAALSALLPESKSEYIGSIKERIRDLEVEVTGSREISGYYGISTVYTFANGDNVLTWITSSCKDIKVGDHVLLTGTVKEHKLYNGVKQTILSRCIIKENK